MTSSLSGCSIYGQKSQSINLNSEEVSNQKAGTSTSSIPNKFRTIEDLKNFLGRSSQAGGSLGGRGGGLTMADAASPMMTKTSGIAGNSEAQVAANDYTKTNNQVAGVDEADIVKTDGNYLYIVSGSSLRIVSAVPAQEARLIAEVELDGQASELFIKDDKLVVFGQSNGFNPDGQATSTSQETALNGSTVISQNSPKTKMIAQDLIMPRYFGEFMFLKEFNITDRTKPILARDFHIEGNYANSRLIGDYVYFVSNKYGYQDIDQPLPRFFSGKAEVLKALPGVYYFDMPYNSYSFTSLNSFNLKDTAEPTREIYLMSGQEQMYVAENNIYLTYTRYLDEQELLIDKKLEIISARLSEPERVKINKIESIEADILNKWEKQQKISQILENYSAKLSEQERKSLDEQIKSAIKQEHPQLANELQTTVIHKININDGTLKYQGQQQVPGQLLNQFSLDEKDGNLRLATSKNQTWSIILDEVENKSFSSVFVLDKDLKLMGNLSNIAPGEQIYSARFIGDRTYLVTFERTDPLFVIDLALPTAPRIVGELKLPGYSSYLHPISENLILGLGKDVKTNEWGGVTPTSLKLGLFDISSSSNPKELSNYTIGDQGSDSSALYDHKAFVFDKAKNLVIMPATLAKKSSNQYDWGRLEFNGALVFSLDGDKISLKAKISHDANFDNSYFDYQKAVRRAVRINENLYMIADSVVKINALSDFTEIKSIKFKVAVPTPIATPFSAAPAADSSVKTVKPSRE